MRLKETILAVCLAFSAQAASITVDFVRAEVPPNSTTTELPYFMNGVTDIIFMKFKVPEFHPNLYVFQR